jgi:hypothetical protein
VHGDRIRYEDPLRSSLGSPGEIIPVNLVLNDEGRIVGGP